MKRIYIFITLIFIALSVCAQSASKAGELFDDGEYAEALPIYEELLKKNPKNLLYCYRCARCLQQTGQHRAALDFFAKTKQKYVLTYFFSGESYMALCMPDEAIDAYNTYLDKDPRTSRKSQVEQQIKKAQLYQRYLKRVQKVEIVDSTYVNRQLLLNGYTVSAETGTLSIDTNSCLSYTNQRGDRRIYAQQVDSQTVLISQYRLLNRWSAAEQLPPNVNFTDKQDFPFLMSDGITTIFAAKDSNGFGGWDIYVTRYNSATNTYTTPENIGLPFNSESNDYLFVVDEKQGIGFFATDRFCTGDSVCVYQFIWKEPFEYLQHLSSDTLGMYAQMKMYQKAEKPQQQLEEDTISTDSQMQQPTDFQLFINPQKVYTSEKDFKSAEALNLFHRYQQQAMELQQVQSKLDEQRLTYHTCTQAQRQTVAALINQLENRVDVLTQRQRQLLTRIQQLEK